MMQPRVHSDPIKGSAASNYFDLGTGLLAKGRRFKRALSRPENDDPSPFELSKIVVFAGVRCQCGRNFFEFGRSERQSC